ncbi:hypothetical protein Btru_066285 [Bulinus truncatus]|nr:hypothetical protein Btru_066285 [Bulinus truncatus]
MQNNVQNLERLVKVLGGRGKFQVTTHLLAAYTYVVLVFNHVIMAFHGTPVPHVCDPGQKYNATSVTDITVSGPDHQLVINMSHSECSTTLQFVDGHSRTVACGQGEWTYKPIYQESNIVSQFDLVCTDSALANLATTIYFAGVMVGGLLFGDLADRFGRLPIMLFTLYSSVVLGVIIAFSVNYVMFVVLRFVDGVLMQLQPNLYDNKFGTDTNNYLCTQGMQTSAYTLIMELFEAKHRPYAGAVTECFFGSSIMLLAGLAFAVRDWRYLQLLISLMGLLAVFYPWVIPESLRWLIVKGKLDKAEQVIHRICKRNKVEFPSELWEKIKNEGQIGGSVTRSPYNLTHLFRTSHIRTRSIILFYIWLSISTSYYGLTFKMSSFQGNRYLNFFIGGAFETVAYAVSLPIMKKFGRKKPLLVCFLLAAATCFTAGFVSDYTTGLSTVTTVLAIIGRCAVACLFAIIFVYTSEIYPTVIRNIGMGACSFWARGGGVLAPQINQWTKSLWNVDAIIIFGALSFIAGLLLFPLPETHNRQLPDSLVEVELKETVDKKCVEDNVKDGQQKDVEDNVKDGQQKDVEDNVKDGQQKDVEDNVKDGQQKDVEDNVKDGQQKDVERAESDIIDVKL